jgi:hypothetical protein
MAMSDVDRRRIEAVSALEALGYSFSVGLWHSPRRALNSPQADAMHSLLVQRADALIGSTDGSADQDELEAIGEAIEAYERVRWPEGKVDGGKGYAAGMVPTLGQLRERQCLCVAQL